MRPTVLIVSGDDAFYLRHRDALSAWYDIFYIKNLNAEIPDEHIDAVVCNVTGLDPAACCGVCEGIRAVESLCHVPLVPVNEKVSSDIRTACLRGGADAYIDDFRSADTLFYQIGNLLSLRSASAPLRTKRSEFKEKIDRILESQLSDMTFSVDALAEQMNMSPTNFYRRFKARMGTTPNNYILEFRMARASQFICEGMYVGEASMRLGYTSSSYFAKCFKKVNGVSPKEYMSRHSF